MTPRAFVAASGAADGPAVATTRFPASFAQERLWFLQRLTPESPLYHIPLGLRLSGRLDAGALERALSALVERHEALRTRFPDIDGGPLQEVVAPEPFVLPVCDVGGVSPERRDSQIRLLAEDEARRPFDLARGPLHRVRLLRLGAEEHVLLWTLHHIISDGWSVGVLIGDLAELYTALAEGRPAEPAPPPLQYADYAVWQRRWLRGEVLEGQLEYWRRRLAGIPAEVELPADHSRPALPSHHGSTIAVGLPAELTAALHRLSRLHGTTLFMTLLAAVQALLSRYSGSDDVIVGSPVAGRTRSEIERVVGPFVNTLPLRTDLSGDPTFAELLGRVREVVLGAAAHQDVPFDRLVAELHPARDLGSHPLFRVMLSLENLPPVDPELAGLVVTEYPTTTATAKFDLALSFRELDGRLEGILEYGDELFEQATAERMLGHLESLLRCVTADPELRLSELALLGEEERHRLLVEWNRTSAEFPHDATIHGLVEEQAERRPEATAVVCGDESVTYAELNSRANRLARHLRALGVRPEVPVGICVDRGVAMVVGLLGILKAGGAYVPLDPGHPPSRLHLLVEDSAVPVLLTQSSLLDRLPHLQDVRVVCLDRDRVEVARRSDGPLRVRVDPGNLAYVIYTSGSTGAPKGVMVEHRGVVNLAVWHRRRYAVTAEDRATQLAATGYDAAVWELWPYLTAGASVWLPDDEVRRSPARLWSWLRDREITLTFLPTPLAEEVLAAGEPPGPALRTLLTGGDRLRRHPGEGTGVALVNHYGPTECTVVATAGAVENGGHAGDEGAPAIGRPIANTRAYVLDERREPVPVGVPGQLYLAGVGVARGYLHRPDLTAERFLPDPFSDEPGARLYRTGDRVRYRPDGSLEFLGRVDEQVKIRGHRVEPGEIEARLVSHPGVRQAVVVAREDAGGERRLVAYMVAGATAPTSAGELRAHLRQSLPEYMVPADYVVVDALPLTPNGKLDRGALPTPRRGSEPSAGHVAPRTRDEEVIAAVWRRVLGVETVGVHDDFFQLGGNSLQAVRMLSEVERELGCRSAVASIFQDGSTVAGLALVLRAAPAPPSDRPAFFMVFSDESSMVALRHFIAALDGRWTVVGLLPPRHDRHFDPDKGVPELARELVAEIRARVPHGPYRICGHSLGGLLAYEIAGQLRSAGEEVAWLGLLDTATPEVCRVAAVQCAQLRWRMRRFVLHTRLVGPSTALRELAMRRIWRLRNLLGLPLAPDDWDGTGALRVATTYSVVAHDVPLDLFATGPWTPDGGTAGLGWESLHRGPLLQHPVPGDHGSLLEEPNVAGMLEIVARRLREIDDHRDNGQRKLPSTSGGDAPDEPPGLH